GKNAIETISASTAPIRHGRLCCIVLLLFSFLLLRVLFVRVLVQSFGIICIVFCSVMFLRVRSGSDLGFTFQFEE
ncbi:hypothetical protein A2U01_0056434, partial [Trifolium medium]|nr:hypothetical protein [Trifolium medium]